MCIYIHIHMYICIYIYTPTPICIYIHKYTSKMTRLLLVNREAQHAAAVGMYTHLTIYLSIYICTCNLLTDGEAQRTAAVGGYKYIHTHKCICAYTYINTHTYTYIHIYTHIHDAPFCYRWRSSASVRNLWTRWVMPRQSGTASRQRRSPRASASRNSRI